MKIVCTVLIGNRQISNTKPTKHIKSTLALCKHPNKDEYHIILFTTSKGSIRYNLKNNVKQILTRFINEGKCTIQFHQPQHDLFIQSDVIQLKAFLHLLKRVLENKLCPKEFTVSSLAVTAVKPKDMAPTKLVITKPSDYPSRGFPRSLENLSITSIPLCSVDKSILQLANLKMLDLSHNYIESIPKDINRLRLKEINLADNKLGKSTSRNWDWIGGALSKSLLVLDLQNNQLERIPNQICKFYNLTSLNLSNNNLKALPHGIGNMKNLKSVSASNNLIAMLPGSIKQLRLQFLNVSHNKFLQMVESPPIILKPTPAYSLKESAGRKVLDERLPYFPGSLPLTLIRYLDDAKYCMCGRACFEGSLKGAQPQILTALAETVEITSNDRRQVLLDCYFCSQKCYNCTFPYRTRNRIVR